MNPGGQVKRARQMGKLGSQMIRTSICYRPSSMSDTGIHQMVEQMGAMPGDVARAGEDYFLEQYISLDFRPELIEPVKNRLGALTDALFEPFQKPLLFSMGNKQMDQKVKQVLGPDRWAFRMAGPASRRKQFLADGAFSMGAGRQNGPGLAGVRTTTTRRTS